MARTRWQIYYDILKAIDALGAFGVSVRHALKKANIQYSYGDKLIELLAEAGLILLTQPSLHQKTSITSLGYRYIRQYEKMQELLR